MADKIADAFARVKKDIRMIQASILEIQDKQLQIMTTLGRKEDFGETSMDEEDSMGESFVASKSGKSFHSSDCALIKNISDKNRITFSSEAEAKKKGYKAHSCV
jgi:hypothetical protein